MPISGLVVTFASSLENHADAIESLRVIPEIDLGQASGSKLAIVVDSGTQNRDQEIWNTVQALPGVIDLAVAMVAFDKDNEDDPSPRNRR
ncbi:chaperone NapD [Planctomycetes bacterium K23_9]|uniref:chaperone NapD n=1 Tax=Stieleria marina TaxID=1930275 RepID=UPI0011A8A413